MTFTPLKTAWDESRVERTDLEPGQRVASVEQELGRDMTVGRRRRRRIGWADPDVAPEGRDRASGDEPDAGDVQPEPDREDREHDADETEHDEPEHDEPDEAEADEAEADEAEADDDELEL